MRHVLPLALARLVKLARRSDVVMAGSEEGIGILLSYLAATLTRRPFVVLAQADIDESIATWVPRRLQRANRYVLAHCDAAISVADSIVPGLVANGLAEERVSVVLNGIDVQDVRARAGLGSTGSTPRRGSAGGVPTVLGLGRLSWEKDFPLLVRAHARVLAAGVDHRLDIVGRGPLQAELESVIAEMGVADSVRLLGYVDNAYEHMAAADLFVLSSRSEGMPLTVLEALAVGVPVVATKCSSGVDLLLDGGRYGDMVPAESVEALADAIEKNLRIRSALRGPRRRRPGAGAHLRFLAVRGSRTPGAARCGGPRGRRRRPSVRGGRVSTASWLIRGVKRRLKAGYRELLLRRQRLHNYEPTSMLRVAESSVPAARVPAIDIHNHLGRWLNGGRVWMAPDVGALVATMDELNVTTMVNLDGRWDDELEANLDRYDRRASRSLSHVLPVGLVTADRSRIPGTPAEGAAPGRRRRRRRAEGVEGPRFRGPGPGRRARPPG